MTQDKSYTDENKYRPDMNSDEWITCPECESNNAYHVSDYIWSYDGHIERVVAVGEEHELRCPDCGLWTST